MATITTIQTRVRSAVDKLIQADRNNPNTELSLSDIRANPYRPPPGDNGRVNRDEAGTVQSPFAKSVYEAAAMKAGKPYLEGGGPGGFEEKVMPAFDLEIADLRKFASYVNLIAAKLETDPTGEVTQAALDRLPQTVEDFFKTEGRGLEKVPRLTLDRMVAVLREAATGGVDWF